MFRKLNLSYMFYIPRRDLEKPATKIYHNGVIKTIYNLSHMECYGPKINETTRDSSCGGVEESLWSYKGLSGNSDNIK